MITAEMVPQLFGDEVFDRDGQKVGKVGHVYIDHSGQPVWATVKTGLFGTKETVVPLGQARVDGEALRLPITKDQVKDAPRIDTDATQMSPQEEQEIHHYYGQQYPVPGRPDQGVRGRQRPADPPAGEQQGLRAGGQPPGHQADLRAGQRQDAMTVSEEHLKVGTEQVETGRVRLRKYVVTEQQQVTVPVRHEEVRLEREPITDASRQRAMSGVEIAEAEQVETLHAERPVVQKETRPVEQVRLAKETVTEEQTLSDEIRKEHIEVQDDSGLLADDDRSRPSGSSR